MEGAGKFSSDGVAAWNGRAEGDHASWREPRGAVSPALSKRPGRGAICGACKLGSVDLGQLETLQSLTVTDNPSLDTTGLAALRTFETRLEGNAGDESPNRIRVDALNDIDRRILKETFRVARGLQQRMQLDYER